MTPNIHAFVIDDDREMRASLLHLCERAGLRASTFSDASVALAKLTEDPPDVILSDVRMPRMSGLDLLTALGALDDAPPLVLISAHGDIPMAVKAMQDGAYSFLEKPYDPRGLLSIMTRAAQSHRLRAETRRLRAALGERAGLDRVLLGKSPRIAALRDDVFDIAHAEGGVLITGETGTGKELVARALHNLGPRKDGPFVAVNCANIDPDRFDEQVFGRAGGSLGLVRSADAGTLFLDEVGACPLPAQAQLLRVIETGELRPLGSDDPVRTSLRIIAATNEDLSAGVTDGTFRSDLLFRLNAFELALPPLRDRGEDVVLLFDTFVAELSQTYEIAAPELTAEDAATLLAHDWPGNVRELRHAAERRALAARRGGGSVALALRLGDDIDDVPATLREAVAAFERTLIAKAIRAHSGRMDAVAEALGIGRRTLNEKIVKLGLDKSRLID